MRLGSALSRRERFHDSSTHTFPAPPGGRLTVSADLGTLEVRTSADEGVVRVEVFREAETDDYAEAVELFRLLRVGFEPHDGGLHVRAERLARRKGLELRLSLKVPPGYTADLETGAGAVTVVGPLGEVRARTAAGSLHFEDLRGDLSAETRAGAVSVINVSGRVHARTDAGAVNVEQGQAGAGPSEVEGGEGLAVDVSTGAGDMRARVASQPAGAWRLSTDAGDIEVSVGAGVALSIDARAAAGRAVTEIPATGDLGGSGLKATVNGGGPGMLLQTTAGDIRLREI